MSDSNISILAALALREGIRLTDTLTRPLNDPKVKNALPAKTGQKLPDGGGLFLFVSPSGSKLWRYRYRLNGMEQTFSIGAYPAVGLADARDAHRVCRWLVERGEHPLTFVESETKRLKAEREAAELGTFKAVWERFDAASRGNLAASTAKHRARHLENYILPVVGNKAVGEITRSALSELLSEIDQTKPVTAKFCRLYLKQVLDQAVEWSLIVGNPVPGAKVLVNASSRKETPRKALPLTDLGRFVTTLKDSTGTDVNTKGAMMLLLLTWCRTGEVVGAEWQEFDLANAVWRIPAGRMKAGEAHTIYLSRQAVALVQGMAELSHGRYLFSNRRRPDDHMCRMTLSNWRKSFGFGEVMDVHGFRATASTWANDSGQHRVDPIEVALAHKEEDRTRAAYNRAEFVGELRQLWQAWADLIDEKEAIARGLNVIELDARKAV